MTPFVEAARQLVRSLSWHRGDFVTHDGGTLNWRHHGLGMLQAEFSEKLRIHIWHPSLVSSGMTWPRCVHDHRFDITSAVVIGEVIDVPCEVTWGDHEMRGIGYVPVDIYEIEHAKNQDRMVLEKGCSTATSAKRIARGSVQSIVIEEVRRALSSRYTQQGEYFIPRRRFHTTRVRALAITVVHRANFDDRLARVLCAPDSDVTAISGIVRDESIEHRVLINHVLRKASDAIANMGSL